MQTVNVLDQPGLGSRKTLIVMVTVIGCIAFLWPKVFYPMMFGGGPTKSLMKDHRGSGCCDVVLDQEESFGNTTYQYGEKAFRNTLNLIAEEISIRQERPPHLRPDSVHPAMRERGRNIPPIQNIVPIIERVHQPPVQPRIVEGRPGPIAGMRPPLGAGSVNPATPKPTTMGFLMPLYTVAIVSFFVYTIMKLVFKKPQSNIPYGPIQSDPNFHKQVFSQEPVIYKRPDEGRTKLGLNHHHNHPYVHENGGNSHVNGILTNHHHNDYHECNHMNGKRKYIFQSKKIDPNLSEEEQLMEINLLRQKLQETESAMAKIIAQMGRVPSKGQETNVQQSIQANGVQQTASPSVISNGHAANAHDSTQQDIKIKSTTNDNNKKVSGHDREKATVKILGLEMTTSCEGGQKWGQSLTPLSKQSNSVNVNLLNLHDNKKLNILNEIPTPTQAIYLEGALPHESQILVSDSETSAENLLLDDEEYDGEINEPAVVLSSKMTLSLISLDPPKEEEFQTVTSTTNGNGLVENERNQNDEHETTAVSSEENVDYENEEYEDEAEDEKEEFDDEEQLEKDEETQDEMEENSVKEILQAEEVKQINKTKHENPLPNEDKSNFVEVENEESAEEDVEEIEYEEESEEEIVENKPTVDKKE